MAEHDYVIANQNGANTRSDLNNALAAIVSNNSKASAPTTTYAYMWWADTANDILKQRNGADSAWISILTLSTGAPLATIANFTSTGIDDNATSTAITIDSAEHVSLAHGIGFNGDTAAANALDDYEEGTWTMNMSTSTGGTTPTIQAQTATYTKIGRKVTLLGYYIISNLNSTTSLYITGLPFTPAASPVNFIGKGSNTSNFKAASYICSSASSHLRFGLYDGIALVPVISQGNMFEVTYFV